MLPGRVWPLVIAVVAIVNTPMVQRANGRAQQTGPRPPLAQVGRPVFIDMCKESRDRDTCETRNVTQVAGQPEFRCYWNGANCLVADVCPTDCTKSQTCRRCPSMPDLCQPTYLPCPSPCHSFSSESGCNAWSTRRANFSACFWNRTSNTCLGNDRTVPFPTAILSAPTSATVLQPETPPTPSVPDQAPEEDSPEANRDTESATPGSVSGSEPVSLTTVLYASGSLALLLVFGLLAMIAHWRYNRRKRNVGEPLKDLEDTKPRWMGPPLPHRQHLGQDPIGSSEPTSPATMEAVPLTGNSIVIASSTSRPVSPATVVDTLGRPPTVPRPGTPPSSSRFASMSGSRSSASRQASMTRSLDRTTGHWQAYYPIAKRQDWLRDGTRSAHGDLKANSGDTSRPSRDHRTLSPQEDASAVDNAARSAPSWTVQRPSTRSNEQARVGSPAVSEALPSPPRLPSLEFPSTLSRPSATASSLSVAAPAVPSAPVPRPSPAWPVTAMRPMFLAHDPQPAAQTRRGLLAPGHRQQVVSPHRLMINSMAVSERDIILDNITPDKARMTMLSIVDSDVGLAVAAAANGASASTVPGVSHPPAIGLSQLTCRSSPAHDSASVTTVYALNTHHSNHSSTVGLGSLADRTDYSPFLSSSDMALRELALMRGRPTSSVIPSPSVVSTLFTPLQAVGGLMAEYALPLSASSVMAMVGSREKDMLAGQAPVTPASPYSLCDIGYYAEPGALPSSPNRNGKALDS